MEINEAKIYVGTYGKYNAGSINGKWLDLSDYSSKDEFYKACEELHKDESDPEFMFQDHENIPSQLISESWISDSLFEFIEAMKDLGEDQQEALYLFVNNFGQDLEDIESTISDFQDSYQGEYEDEEEYAKHIIDECHNLEDPLAYYFDYEKYARDLFMSDYTFIDGHVFNSNF